MASSNVTQDEPIMLHNHTDFTTSPREIYAVAVPCLWVLAAAAIVANTLILVSFRRIRRTPPSAQSDAANPFTLRLTQSLAACDLWLVGLQAFGLLINSYLPTVVGVYTLTDVPRVDCCVRHALEALRLGAILSSVLHLLALAAVHYAFTVKHAVAAATDSRGGLWTAVVPAIWLAPPGLLLGVLLAHYPVTFGAAVCQVYFASNFWRVSLLASVAGPILLVLILYGRILLFLKRLHDAVLVQKGAQVERASLAQEPIAENCVVERRKLTLLSTGRRRSSMAPSRQRGFIRRRIRTVGRLTLIVGTFLMGWLPIAGWFAMTCDSCPYPTAYLVAHAPALFYTNAILAQTLNFIKAILNPVIYAYAVPDIRRALRATLGLRVNSRSANTRKKNGLSTYSRRQTTTLSSRSLRGPVAGRKNTRFTSNREMVFDDAFQPRVTSMSPLRQVSTTLC